MKKLCMLFAFLMTVVTVILFSSCAPSGMDGVSERRSGYYSAADGEFKVIAVSGVREKDYARDSKVGDLVPYTLITLSDIDETAFDVDAVITYEAVVNNGDGEKRYGGALITHPFAASYSAEFEFETTAKSFTVGIVCDGKRREYTLESQTDGVIAFDRAIAAARDELDGARGEIRARIIKNPVGEGVCWHVEFITAESSCGVLLDPKSAKVLAKKAV